MNARRYTIRTLLAGVAVVALAGGCGSLLAQTPSSTSTKPVAASAEQAAKDLKSLTVAAAGSMDGYSRTKFHIWASQGGGCDTRDVVLKRDGHNVQATSDCKITSGDWTSPYNDKTYHQPLQLDIDHLVPLGDAWQSGAASWSDDKREQFANDLTRPQLLAVDSSDNRIKGDQDPSTWKPPEHSFWCTYAKDWITVKTYWKLTVTTAEKAALQDMLQTCS
jgi:hypothetical protein